MLQAKFASTRLFIVPPGAFRPAPKVESAVARLVPLGAAKPAHRRRGAVRARRRRRVRAAAQDAAQRARRRCATPTALRAAGIDPAARGETLVRRRFRAAAPIGSLRPTARVPVAIRARAPAVDAHDLLRATSRRAQRDVAQRHAEGLGQEAHAARRSPCRRPAARRGGSCSASPCTPATVGALRARLHVQRQHERVAARSRQPRGRVVTTRNSRVSDAFEPRHQHHQQQLRDTITISGDRSSVPPSGGTTCGSAAGTGTSAR